MNSHRFFSIVFDMRIYASYYSPVFVFASKYIEIKESDSMHRGNLKILGSALAISFFIIALSASSFALELSGQSQTYLQSRETTDSKNHLPLYEYLNFEAAGVGHENISFHFGGWLRYDLWEETFGQKSNSDLQYAYLTIRRDKGNGELNLGRLFVREGVATILIDGAYVRTDLRGGFGIATFGGIPVDADFDNRSGDSVYGGRLSHSMPNLYTLGASYLKEENGNQGYREEAGIDLWLRPVDKVELNGTSSYNALTYGWAEHAYTVTLGPIKNVRLIGSVSNIHYGDYFTPSTTTAFKFDPTIIDPNERLTTVGGTIAYASKLPLPYGLLTASADYKAFAYAIAGHADYYGANLAYAESKIFGLGLSLHRMAGDTDKLKYFHANAYAFRKFGRIDLTGSIITVFYDSEINNVKDAYSFILAGGYQATKKIRLGVDVEYSRNPFFDRDFRGFIKLVYNFELLPFAKGGK
jgi:hypothetical protein